MCSIGREEEIRAHFIIWKKKQLMVQRSNKAMEISKQIILKTFSFLEEEYYYTPVAREEESNIFMESLDLEYINNIRRRSISISYTKGKLSDDLKFTYTASITLKKLLIDQPTFFDMASLI